MASTDTALHGAVGLHQGRRNAVPGEGDARARVVLVGEAPGAREDQSGRPFCGTSGRFLDGLLAGLGMRRKDLFITSSVKCRPPGNRTPHIGELSTCLRLWLEPQIGLIKPGPGGPHGQGAGPAGPRRDGQAATTCTARSATWTDAASCSPCPARPPPCASPAPAPPCWRTSVPSPASRVPTIDGAGRRGGVAEPHAWRGIPSVA